MIPTPEFVYVCENEDCVWKGEERFVSLTPVAPGLYARPCAIVCECDYEVYLSRREETVNA